MASPSSEHHPKLNPVAPGAGKWWDIRHLRYLVQAGFGIFIIILIYNRAVSPLSGPAAPTTPEAYCPLGSVQQAITGARRWLQKRIGAFDRFAAWLSRMTKPAAFLDRWLRYAKYLVLAWIVWGTITYGTMVFRDVDPWAALLNIVESQAGIGFWVLIATLVASLFGDRPWCRYLCPLGAITGGIGKLSLIKVQREAAACIGCNRCTRKCPMDLPVHAKSRVAAVECNMCLSCIDVCPAKRALELRFNLPWTRRDNQASEGSAK